MREARPSRDVSPAVDEAVRAARLDIVFGGQPMALTVSVVLAAITVAVMRGAESIATSALFSWFGVLTVLSALRGWLYRGYRLERKRGIADLPTWEGKFHLGCLAAGAVWGSSALLFFPADTALQVFLAFVLAGVSAGATTELAVMPRTAHAFVVPCVLPLALRFFLQGDGLHIAMGTMAFLYVGLITSAGRRGQAQLKQTVAAQLDATATRHALTETTQRVEVMKTEFVSIVSHELRTPLTAIRGALGLIAHQAGDGLPESAGKLLQVAARNAERLHVLVEDLLDIEKIESGTLRFELKYQPLLPLIEQSLARNVAYAMTHLVDFELVPGPADVAAVVDASRFQQVMDNLLSNAAKFSPARGTVRIAVLRNGDRARIEVRDRGPGIPLAQRPRMFTKFSQGDASDSRSKGGTGLGLAISKAIVEQMNGSIGFESGLGAGTTFFVELPVTSGSLEER